MKDNWFKVALLILIAAAVAWLWFAEGTRYSIDEKYGRLLDKRTGTVYCKGPNNSWVVEAELK